MRTIVLYYSHKGSNRFLANRMAQDLSCEIEEIVPRWNSHILMIMGVNLGIHKLKSKVREYDRVILCGPVWVGKLIVPLKEFIRMYAKEVKQLVFVTCCGSSFKDKDSKYGYNLVFNKVKGLLNEKCEHCHAFPISMFTPLELKDDPNAYKTVHLNENNFEGEIVDAYNGFISRLAR